MREIICVVCPRGCHLQVDEQTLKVTGNHCERGAAYGPQELLEPKRVMTSTVRLDGCKTLRRCPVKTSGSIPKAKMQQAVDALSDITVSIPVTVGQVIKADFLSLGVDLVATRTILE